MASWGGGDDEVRATLSGPDAGTLVERVAEIRPHLVATTELVVGRVVGNRVEGVAVLPLASGGELRVPITATVEAGRVVAEPSALARQLRTWPDLRVERWHVPPGRLLDRRGDPFGSKGSPLERLAREALAARLGGGWGVSLRADGATLATHRPSPAADVRLAADPALQGAAEHVVGSGDGRALVAVDAATGEILAVAGGPAAGSPVAGAAVPVGSVLKIATATAALLDGHDPEDQVPCPAVAVIDGRAVMNVSQLELGRLSLRRAFALSCNTTFAQLGSTLGGDAVREAAEALGFDAEIPGTEMGHVEAVSGGDAAALGFGAAGAHASPVALASVAATIGARGVRHAPRWEVGRSPDIDAIPTSVADDLLVMMRDVVENGTARAADVAGVQIFAKTGTPRRIVDGAAVDDAITVAVVKVAGRTLGVAAVVLEGESGGKSAAPIVARFVRALVTQ